MGAGDAVGWPKFNALYKARIMIDDDLSTLIRCQKISSCL